MTDAPKLKPLRYIIPQGDTLEQMRDAARSHPLAQVGDLTLVWVNEGDLHNHSTLWDILAPDPKVEVEAMIGAVLEDVAQVIIKRGEAFAQSLGTGQIPIKAPEAAFGFSIGDSVLAIRALRPDAMQVLERKLREARVEGMRDALAAVTARHMGDNNREDLEVSRCANAIRALIDKGARQC